MMRAERKELVRDAMARLRAAGEPTSRKRVRSALGNTMSFSTLAGLIDEITAEMGLMPLAPETTEEVTGETALQEEMIRVLILLHATPGHTLSGPTIEAARRDWQADRWIANPLTAPALASLCALNVVIRNGAGVRGDPYSYELFLTPPDSETARYLFECAEIPWPEVSTPTPKAQMPPAPAPTPDPHDAWIEQQRARIEAMQAALLERYDVKWLRFGLKEGWAYHQRETGNMEQMLWGKVDPVVRSSLIHTLMDCRTAQLALAYAERYPDGAGDFQQFVAQRRAAMEESISKVEGRLHAFLYPAPTVAIPEPLEPDTLEAEYSRLDQHVIAREERYARTTTIES